MYCRWALVLWMLMLWCRDHLSESYTVTYRPRNESELSTVLAHTSASEEISISRNPVSGNLSEIPNSASAASKDAPVRVDPNLEQTGTSDDSASPSTLPYGGVQSTSMELVTLTVTASTQLGSQFITPPTSREETKHITVTMDQSTTQAETFSSLPEVKQSVTSPVIPSAAPQDDLTTYRQTTHMYKRYSTSPSITMEDNHLGHSTQIIEKTTWVPSAKTERKGSAQVTSTLPSQTNRVPLLISFMTEKHTRGLTVSKLENTTPALLLNTQVTTQPSSPSWPWTLGYHSPTSPQSQGSTSLPAPSPKRTLSSSAASSPGSTRKVSLTWTTPFPTTETWNTYHPTNISRTIQTTIITISDKTLPTSRAATLRKISPGVLRSTVKITPQQRDITNIEENIHGKRWNKVVVPISCTAVFLAILVLIGWFFSRKRHFRQRRPRNSTWAGFSPFLNSTRKSAGSPRKHFQWRQSRQVTLASILLRPVPWDTRSENILVVEAPMVGTTFGKHQDLNDASGTHDLHVTKGLSGDSPAPETPTTTSTTPSMATPPTPPRAPHTLPTTMPPMAPPIEQAVATPMPMAPPMARSTDHLV